MGGVARLGLIWIVAFEMLDVDKGKEELRD